jgi:CDP-glycerol glycerophosphotransferase (TagB/SpsB family)
VSILDDVNTARRILRNLVRSRRTRNELARILPSVPKPAPGSVQIAVYFADTRVNLYQIRQWFSPLAEANKLWPVTIITRSPGTMLTLLEESPVPVVYLRKVVELEDFVDEQDIKIVFYVNQNAKNFQMMRYGRMWHVFINHGESDKMYMTTNQFKAYDYALVAGEAARDRLRRKLWDFDVDKKTLMIGRPQADHFAGALPYAPDERTVVLYAPTWEGDRDAAAYGSVVSHGEQIAARVLASPAHRLIYRPHPRTGVIDPEFRRANQAIIDAIAAANARDVTAQHVFDDGPTLGWQLAAADVAITDISAMVYDRLAVGKPLLIARPASAGADVDESGFLGAAEWLTAEEAPDVLAILDRVQHSEEARRRLEFWVERHFGDTTPGVTTRRFHEAIGALTAEWEKHAALHAEEPRLRESHGADDGEDEDSARTLE